MTGNISIGLLKATGFLAGGVATVYYAFSIVTTTAANYTIFKTLPLELRKQSEILNKILEKLEGLPNDQDFAQRQILDGKK